MITHWTAIIFACALCPPLTALADSSGTSAKVQIFKCVSRSGTVSFQKSPCLASERAQRLRLNGDSQANRDAAKQFAATQAQTNRNRQDRDALEQAAYLRARAGAASAPQEKPPVVCPPTFGDVATMQAPITSYYDASGRQHTSYQDMSMQYRSLPTKTYLKNAGRWPKECPQ